MSRSAPTRWPAWYLTADEPVGTIYVPHWTFPEIIRQYGYKGRAWRFHKKWSSYRPNNRVAYKALHALSLDGREDFERVMAECQSADVPPPTSFGSLFAAVTRVPWPRHSVTAPFAGPKLIRGGWQAAEVTGRVQGHVYQYDLISAYRWASQAGLPCLATAEPATSLDDHPALYLAWFEAGQVPYAAWPGWRPWSSEEWRQTGLEPKRVQTGVRFRKLLSLDEAWDEIDRRFPYAAKRIGRAYWGRWIGREGLEQVSWGGGEEHVSELPNKAHNPIWAHYITSRVKLRLAAVSDRLHVFVDSVMTRDPLPTGNQIGDWKLADEFDDGVWIKAPGQWGVGNYYRKHAGIKGQVVELPDTPFRVGHFPIYGEHARGVVATG